MSGEAAAGGGDGGGAGNGVSPGGMGEARQVAPPGPSASNDNGKAEKQVADKEPPATKYKTKRGGKELEHTGEELARFYSDEHEHEFNGPGGKPIKLKWPEIGRAVQMSHGALARMQKLAEREKELEQSHEWGKKNVGAFLEAQLGVEDHEQWALEIAKQRFLREQELSELATSNPSEYHRRMEKSVAEKLERKNALEKQRAQAAQQTKESREHGEKREREVGEALKAAGVPVNKLTMSMAAEIYGEHRRAQFQLQDADLADLTRKAYREQIYGYLDAMDDDSLFEFFGDGRRKRLRELEVASARGKKREETQQQRQQQAQQQSKTPDRKGLTEAELKAKYRA